MQNAQIGQIEMCTEIEIIEVVAEIEHIEMVAKIENWNCWNWNTIAIIKICDLCNISNKWNLNRQWKWSLLKREVEIVARIENDCNN